MEKKRFKIIQSDKKRIKGIKRYFKTNISYYIIHFKNIKEMVYFYYYYFKYFLIYFLTFKVSYAVNKNELNNFKLKIVISIKHFY